MYGYWHNRLNNITAEISWPNRNFRDLPIKLELLSANNPLHITLFAKEILLGTVAFSHYEVPLNQQAIHSNNSCERPVLERHFDPLRTMTKYTALTHRIVTDCASFKKSMARSFRHIFPN